METTQAKKGHQSGPWGFFIDPIGDGAYIIDQQNDRVGDPSDPTVFHPVAEQVEERNIHLIAAAPDLKNTLREIEQELTSTFGEPPAVDDDWEPEHSLIAKARMALGKAEGGAA